MTGIEINTPNAELDREANRLSDHHAFPLTASPGFVLAHLLQERPGIAVLDELAETHPAARNPALECAFRDSELACCIRDRHALSGKQYRIAVVCTELAEGPSDVAQLYRLVLPALGAGQRSKASSGRLAW